MSVDLYVPFIARELGTTPDRVKLEKCNAAEIAELLWPLASFFQTAAGSADYRQEAEAEADAVLEALEADPTDWGDVSRAAARVLLARTTYAISVLMLNEGAGETVICPPRSLDPDIRRVAAALCWLHRMDLPA